MAINPYFIPAKQPLKQWQVDQYAPLPIKEIGDFGDFAREQAKPLDELQGLAADLNPWYSDIDDTNALIAEHSAKASELASDPLKYSNPPEFNRRRDELNREYAPKFKEITKRREASEAFEKKRKQLGEKGLYGSEGRDLLEQSLYTEDPATGRRVKRDLDYTANIESKYKYKDTQDKYFDNAKMDRFQKALSSTEYDAFLEYGFTESNRSKINKLMKPSFDAYMESPEGKQQLRAMTGETNFNDFTPNQKEDAMEAIMQQMIVSGEERKQYREDVRPIQDPEYMAKLHSGIGREEKIEPIKNNFVDNVKDFSGKSTTVAPKTLNNLFGLGESTLLSDGGVSRGDDIVVNYASLNAYNNIMASEGKTNFNTARNIFDANSEIKVLQKKGMTWDKIKAGVFGTDNTYENRRINELQTGVGKEYDKLLYSIAGYKQPLYTTEDWSNLPQKEKDALKRDKRSAEAEVDKYMSNFTNISKEDLKDAEDMNLVSYGLKNQPQVDIAFDSNEENVQRRIEFNGEEGYKELHDFEYTSYIPVEMAGQIDAEGDGDQWGNDDELDDVLDRLVDRKVVKKTWITNKQGEEIEVYAVPGIRTMDLNSQIDTDSQTRYNLETNPGAAENSFSQRGWENLSAKSVDKSNIRNQIRTGYYSNFYNNIDGAIQEASSQGINPQALANIKKMVTNGKKSKKDALLDIAELEIKAKKLNR